MVDFVEKPGISEFTKQNYVSLSRAAEGTGPMMPGNLQERTPCKVLIPAALAGR